MKEQPLQMTGEEIARTFGARDVLELEHKRDALLTCIDDLRRALADNWEDDELVERTQNQIEERLAELRVLRRDLQEKRNRYGEAIDSTSPLPMA